MDAIRSFAADGGPVLGICNGFQILCEAGLLPGVLRANRQVEFVCATSRSRSSRPRRRSRVLRPGETLVIPIKHGEGNWVADDALFADVVARGQVALRYATDVNGSRDRVAGVASEDGNVLGLMPHPEHAVDPLLGPTGGLPLCAASSRRRANDSPRPSERPLVGGHTSIAASVASRASAARSCGVRRAEARASRGRARGASPGRGARPHPSYTRTARAARLVTLQELDPRGEALRAGPLGQDELLDDRGPAPWCRGRRHGGNVAREV